ncbi:extracellular solute-binding protein [Candidatus Actinomarina]|jgi:iron(III) transport system substrate-binding protein|nr:extracellular solute-binding protein [Candidatus Actinomarina sp.]
MNKKSISLLVACLMVFTACAGGDAGEAGPQGEQGEKGEAGEISQAALDAAVEAALAEEEAAVEGSLVIYSGRKESLVADVIAAFAAETGVAVEVRYDKSAALAGTLALEGAISPADVFLSQDPVSLGVVAKEGLFDVLPADVLDNVPAWAVDQRGYWVGTSGRSRSLVVDTRDTTDAEMPSDIYGLNDEKFRGRLGLAPGNSSFIAMVACMIESDGEEKVAEWLTAINGLGYTEYPKNSPQVAAADAGELDIGMINHYYTLRVLAENGDSPVKNVYLDGGCGAMVMPAGAGVLSSSQNKPAAIAFIEYLHSTSAQEHFTNTVFEFPLVPGITPNALLPGIDSLNSPEDLNWSALALWQEKAVELIAQAGF